MLCTFEAHVSLAQKGKVTIKKHTHKTIQPLSVGLLTLSPYTRNHICLDTLTFLPDRKIEHEQREKGK